MLVPNKYRGKEFISLVTVKRLFSGRSKVVACYRATRVRVHYSARSFVTLRLEYPGDITELASTDASHYILSDKPVVFIFYQRAPCMDAQEGHDAEWGNPAFTLVIPTLLFYYSYSWSSPRIFNNTKQPFAHYVLIVGIRDQLLLISLDSVRTTTLIANESPVLGLPGWVLYTLDVATGHHFLYSEDVNFGCYIYGLGQSYAYMHPGGFDNFKTTMPCALTNTHPGDFIDNDCDGDVDEEQLDNKDNDGDGLTDEDLDFTVNIRVTDTTTLQWNQSTNGTSEVDNITYWTTNTSTVTTTLITTDVADEYSWSDWTEWQCSRDCSNTSLVRSRMCNITARCKGDNIEYTNGDCYTIGICPNDCHLGQWGVNCLGKCTYCDPDCNKFSGTCKLCKIGYRSHNESCLKECGPFTYGASCQESCMAKCKSDCIDRVEGMYSRGFIRLLPLVLIIPVIPMAVLSLLGKKLKNEEGENVSSGNPNMFKGSFGAVDSSVFSTKILSSRVISSRTRHEMPGAPIESMV